MLGAEQGVTDLCSCTDSALINRQLVKARAELVEILSKKGTTVPTTSVTLDTAVEFLASALIAMQPGALNPVSDFKTEDYSRSDWGSGSQSEAYRKSAFDIIDDYVSDNATAAIPQTYIVGSDGVRIGEYTELD